MLVFAIHQHESVIGIHMAPPSWNPLPPPTPSQHSKLSPSTRFEHLASYSKFPLAVYFTYGNTYVSRLLSQFIPLSPSPAVSSSLFSMSAPPLCVCAKSLQSCPTLCDPVDHSPSGSSVPGHSQARILEWVAMPSSRESSQPRDWTQVSVSPAVTGSFSTTSHPLLRPCK